jgi:S1-C subfamily serine protease
MYGGSGYDDGGYGQYGYGGPYDDGGQYGYGPYGGYGYGPGGYPPPPPEPRRRSSLLSHVLVAVLAAGVAAGVVLAATPSTSSSSSGASSPGYTVPGQAPGGGRSAGGAVPSSAEQSVIRKVEPGLVLVNTNLQYNSEEGAGTGMVISPGGLVLTNNHVIEGSTKITVTVASGKNYRAKVVGYDKTGDVAVIQMQGASGLRTVPLGNSASVRTGDPVVALGNAEGQESIVPATGQVTGVNKTIKASDPGGDVTSERLHGMLRTNVPIVRGDSGGPLSTTSGEVIGMDTAGNDSNIPGEGASTGFAIPISTALSIAHQIEAGDASSAITIGYPPFMGIFVAQGNNSNPQAQLQAQSGAGYGGGFGGFGGSGGSGGSGGPGGSQRCASSNASLTLPKKVAPVSSGSLVDGAICGSPADQAGLRGGSVITAVNGQAAGAPDHLTSMLATFHPGQTISVSWVSPSGHKTTSSIHLVAGPPQ